MLETTYGHEQIVTQWRNETCVSDSKVMARWLLRADMVQLKVKVFMVGGHGMMVCSCCGKKTLLSTCMEGGKTMQGNDDSSCKWGLDVIGLEERKREKIGLWEQERKRERKTWP